MNKRLKTLIDSVDVVSFDIFDTLVLRKVKKPSDVFELVEKKYNSISKNTINAFKEKRTKAEKNARLNTNSDEISIDDIYIELEKNIPKIDWNKVKKIEVNIEQSVCYRNTYFDNIISYCKENNKKIVICSDMYLDKESIKYILDNLNIKYDKLFLSSDLKLTKSSGKIFEFIKNDLNIEGKKILHIGDNTKSDIIRAKFNGLKVYRYNNCINDSIINKSINESRKSKIKNDYYEYFGYKYLGPVMLGFCEFLETSLLDKSNIIFLAREGKFIKKCYNIYTNNKQIDKVKYMYVSRKSISSSIISQQKFLDSIISSQSVSQNETIGMFLNRFSLLTDENKIILEKNNLNLNDNLFNKKTKEKLNNVFSLLIHDTSNKSSILEKYLNSFNINNETAIIDIGWNGTMQDLLQRILNNQDIKLEGYYLGVRKDRKNNYKHGFLFNGTEDNDIEMLTRSMTGFLEILFAADHGSTYGYNETEIIEPLLLDNDISADIIKIIEKIQSGAEKFVFDFKDDEVMKLCDFTPIDYCENLLNFALKPKHSDIIMFEKFEVFDEKKINLIGNKEGLKYLIKPKKFIKDYIDSGWKNAFMKSIFRINLPYTLFFKMAYSRRRKI